MNRNPTATLWLFAYGGITALTHTCVLKECLSWPNLDHWAMAGDALISRTRSRAASQFLETDPARAGDVLLMVDHDIGWQLGDLSRIARRALERNAIVAGIYPKRAFGEGSAIRFAPEAKGEWKIGEDKLIPSTYVGSGFVAIPRLVLENLAEKLPWIEEGYWPFFLPMTVLTEADGKQGHEYLSEDWAFCERAREAGFGIYADCLPQLTHEGNYIYRLVDTMFRPPVEREITINLNPVLP